MRGDPNNPFVYQHRWVDNGTRYPWKYGYATKHGPAFGSALESVFMGSESQVRKDIQEGRLPNLPWDN